MLNTKQGPCHGAHATNHSSQIITIPPRVIKGRAKAIDQHCKSCIYDPIGGTGSWREQTKNCTSFSCALWKFRPLPGIRVVEDSNEPGAERTEVFHDVASPDREG